MSKSYIETYYSDTIHTDRLRPLFLGKAEVDVCVIGGGLAGLSTALSLVEKRKKVILLEASRIGGAASGRNGGFVSAAYSKSYRHLSKKIGLVHTKELYDLAVEGRDFIKNRVQTYDIKCGSLTEGILQVAWKGRSSGHVQDYVEFMDQKLNAPLLYWSDEKVRGVCKSVRYEGGCFSPEDFQIHPLNYVRGLAEVLEGLGGQIFEGSAARKITQEESGYRVHIQGGSIKAEQVVLCCSVGVGGLNAKLKYSSFPIYSYAMVTRPLPESRLKEALTTQYGVFDNRYVPDYYRLLPDNRLLWGGRCSMREIKEKGQISDLMMRDLLNVYPQLAGVIQADYVWGGAMCFTSSKMPQIGQIRPGYWYASAFGGEGIGPTSMAGEIIANAIAHGDERYQLFEPFSKLHFTGGSFSSLIEKGVRCFQRLNGTSRF